MRRCRPWPSHGTSASPEASPGFCRSPSVTRSVGGPVARVPWCESVCATCTRLPRDAHPHHQTRRVLRPAPPRRSPRELPSSAPFPSTLRSRSRLPVHSSPDTTETSSPATRSRRDHRIHDGPCYSAIIGTAPRPPRGAHDPAARPAVGSFRFSDRRDVSAFATAAPSSRSTCARARHGIAPGRLEWPPAGTADLLPRLFTT